jgi:hypothetical protein
MRKISHRATVERGLFTSITNLQNDSPKRSLVTNSLAKEDQRDGQSQDRNVDPGHRAEGADIARLYPTIDTVEEAKCDDVLDVELAGILRLAVQALRKRTFSPFTSSSASAFTGR